MKALIIENEPKYREWYKKGIIDSGLFKNEGIFVGDIDAIMSNKYAEILIKNPKIDLFVIDVNLSEEKGCELGLNFLKYLTNNYKHEYKYIIVSEWDFRDLEQKSIIDFECFLAKRSYFKDYLMEFAISKLIEKYYNI